MPGLVPGINVLHGACAARLGWPGQTLPRPVMGSDSPAPQRAFFGRRKGHALKPRQAALFDTLLPRIALDLANAPPVDLRTAFAPTIDDLRLEIGFGGAEHLSAQAQANLRTGFVGTDAFVNAIAKALVAIDTSGLTNIRLHFGDASELLDWLPDATFSRIDLLYPDPWPKRRHWKRRFIQADNLKRLARILKKDGELRFATDIPDYAAMRLRASCDHQISHGRRNMPTTGASPGAILPGPATRPRPNMKGVAPPILFSDE